LYYHLFFILACTASTRQLYNMLLTVMCYCCLIYYMFFFIYDCHSYLNAVCNITYLSLRRSGRPAVPPPAQLIRAPGSINPRFQHGLSSLAAAGYQPLYGGVRPFGAGMIPREEGSSGSRIVGGDLFYSREWAHSGPHSPMNSEAVWTTSSQKQPPPGAPEPASARSPQQNDNMSPDDTSFQ
jgi:hypothetical protein